MLIIDSVFFLLGSLSFFVWRREFFDLFGISVISNEFDDLSSAELFEMISLSLLLVDVDLTFSKIIFDDEDEN